MRVVELPYGEWAPDQPDYKNGVVEADNVYPVSQGFGPFETASATTATTTETVVGAGQFFTNDGSTLIAAGSATRLIVSRSGVVTETTGYTTAERWSFERFNDLVVATSLENDPQYLTDIDSDNTWSALPGTPPKAAQIGKVREFLVLGDVNDTQGSPTGLVPNRVRWSAFNNPTVNWVTDRGELSDYHDLDARYGRVTAIVGGRFGLVFQERAIWRMVFVGAPKVFEFEPVSVDRGCIAANSAVTIAAETFFLSQDGFWVTNGSSVDPIGTDRVNEWFRGEVTDADIRFTHGALNWPKRSIVWAFKDGASSRFNRQIVFNFVLDGGRGRWSSGSQMVDYFTKSQLGSETLASLAVTYPGGLGTMSAFTLGTAEWRASDISFAAFVESGAGSAFAEMSGATAAAEIVTGDNQIEPGRRSRVTGAWPVLESQDSTITTKIRTRDVQGGDIRTTDGSMRAMDGFCPHNVDGWLHSVRTSIPAGVVWDNASGVQVRVKGTGRR